MDIKVPNKAGIYKLTCRDNSKIYIGKSVNLYKRLNSYKNYYRQHACGGLIQKALIKYGWDSFIVEILEVFENFDKSTDNVLLLEKETYYIELFDSTNTDKGYNICKYSTDTTGIPLSEEHKENIRQSKLGKKLSEETKDRIRQGKLENPMSDESREKLRQLYLGKSLSDDHKEKIRQSKSGKVLSEETKEKIRQGNLGRIVSEETKQKMRKPKNRKLNNN